MMDRRFSYRAALIAAALAFSAATAVQPAHAANVSVSNADITFDRWNYPFNGTPGTRGAAPTFGAFGTASFDERDGQFLIGIDTATLGVPTGLAPSNYQINSLSVTATHSIGSFDYDPTYDSYTTYLDSSDPDSTTDTDAGRPIVLTGAALRGDGSATPPPGAPYTQFGFGATVPGGPTYEEGESFGDNGATPFAPDAEDRSAYAAAFDSSGNLIDIGSNVGTNGFSSGFDFTPWAVGTTGLNPGDPVVEAVASLSPGSTFTFDLTPMLADLDVLQYVREGLSNGGLFFSITSLHSTGMSGGTNPNFYTSDNFDPAAIGPQASFDITAVPEPTSLALVAAGSWVLSLRRRGRRTGSA